MAEGLDVLVGSVTEQVGDRHVGGDQDEGRLGHVQRQELRAEGGGVVRPVDEKVLFIGILRVGCSLELNFLGEEDGFYVFFRVKHIHPREDGGVLEGGQTLFEGSVDVPSCRRSGIGRGSTGVRDVLLSCAVARGLNGGCEKKG